MAPEPTVRATWRDRWPRGVLDPYCPDGHLIDTPTDRRLLWHLEGWLMVRATTDEQRQMASDIQQYLNETCVHHWHGYAPDPNNEHDVPAHKQCLWCNDVEWRGEVSTP